MTTDTAIAAMAVLGRVLQLAFTALGVYAAFKDEYSKAAYYIAMAALMFLVARD